MQTNIINGKEIANQLLTTAAEKMAAAGKPVGLAVVIVGENAASQVYVRNKVNACAKTGISSTRYDLPETLSEAELLAQIHALNADDSVHGILVQLPLPKHIDAEKVLETIAVEKDVDGFHTTHMGRLVADLPSLRPCTPAGCMLLLQSTGVNLAGANAVVVGRSHIVGKPMAIMLINAGATVTVCNSKTKDLAAVCRNADVLVAAVGRANFITKDMIKPGAIVIDVGINRLEDGSITGDVDFAGAQGIAGAITPVPGGVGPMTIAMLVHNTLSAADIVLT
ncbi:MAG: bifunctional methylenetetrahydrofolate dehydrogenase/methenyltetrahydrofolate cyclohydrolase FolD [Proteobacteria bacterium]|nr:bifunctional methylenetetrahydrofolate dehydrogenase/methenyltetrahydrofolate cyclohydrolase FolD [Pseudomonadota bacterium]